MPKLAPKRRWFQFRLRTLFVAVTVAATALGWIAWNRKQLKSREAIVLSGLILWIPANDYSGFPLTWRLLGERPIVEVVVSPRATPEEFETIVSAFPEAWVWRSEREFVPIKGD